MKRAVPVLAALFAIGACVPATEEEEPRGGVRAELVASPETAGKPFTSVDGWTVTIEKLALRALLQVGPRASTEGLHFGGSASRPRILAPVSTCNLKATGASTGPAAAEIVLTPSYVEHDDYFDEPCGVGAEMLEHFARPAATAYIREYPSSQISKPSLVVFARARKADRELRLEVGVLAELFGANQTPVDIVANEGVPIRVGVFAQHLFAPRESTASDRARYVFAPPAAIHFDDVAAADANGDGVVTTSELSLAPPSCNYVRNAGEGGNGGGKGRRADDVSDEEPTCTPVVTVISHWNAPQLLGPLP